MCVTGITYITYLDNFVLHNFRATHFRYHCWLLIVDLLIFYDIWHFHNRTQHSHRIESNQIKLNGEKVKFHFLISFTPHEYKYDDDRSLTVEKNREDDDHMTVITETHTWQLVRDNILQYGNWPNRERKGFIICSASSHHLSLILNIESCSIQFNSINYFFFLLWYNH